MKTLMKKCLSILLSALMLFGVIPFIATSEPAEAVSVGSYCATAAVEWAKTHWQEYSSCLLGTNYWYEGGDCANFVSQCLYMGGMDMTGYWNTNGYMCHWTAPYGDTYAGSFIRCTQLYNFLVNVMGARSINNPSASQVDIGDVLIYSRDGSSRKTHSAIVIDIVNGVPIVAAHSADNIKYTGYDGKPEHEWHLGFTHSRIWLLKLNGTTCVNNNRKVFDVYTAASGDLGLYSDAWGSKLTTFLSGEYAHVYRTKTSGGYTWGYTFRYGKWGWVKLSSFTYRSHQESPAVDHIFGAWQLDSPGSCITNRVEKCVCTRCGYTKTRETPGTHIPSGATCTTPSVCTVCGAFLADALGHDASGSYVETLPATCTDAGEETLYCVRENNSEVCGAVLDVREIPALGHDYVAKTTSPFCTLTGTQQLTCTRCQNKVIDYINENNTLSEWTKEEIDGLTPVETKTQYRYSDYETTTSYNTSMSGWNRIGSSWVEESSGAIDYVASFPAGFSTSHSLYTTYHKSPVTASETETRKTTVSTSTVGYLYWHWCRGDGQGASNNWNRLISGSRDSEFNTFHAFFASSRLGKESNSSGYDYSSVNSSLCTSTKWWLAGNTDDLPNTNDNDLPVLRCSYKNYKNLFTYERWTVYSNWQDDPVSASSTRRVETQTVYRYDLKELGHLPAVSEEKNYYEMDAEVAYSDTNDYPACYWLGTFCTRPGCGAQLDTTDYAHVFPVFDASAIDASVWSVAEQSNESVTIYKAYCSGGCGCYVLKTVENHSYTLTTVPPTCTLDGYDLHTCTLHDDCYYVDNTVPALGHDYSGEQEYVAPTCTAAGYLKTYCVRYDNGVTCDAFSLEEYEPLGHRMTEFEATGATCLLDGNTEYWFCGVCGKYFADENGTTEIEEDSWIIPATGHNGANGSGKTVWTVEVENGCGVTGWEYNYCQNPWCDGIGACQFHNEHSDHGYLLDARDIPEIAPDYYVAYTNEYAEYDEDAGEYVPTSCLNEGIVYVTCRNCEGTDHAHSYLPDVVYAPESVGILEHIPGEWAVEQEAHCVHEGSRTQSCTRCGTLLDEETIAAPFMEHDYYIAKTYNSECSAGTDGHHYVCSRCGETECESCNALGIPHHYWDGDPVAHDLGDYIVTQEPTCTGEGYKHRECRNDGCDYATTDETIPPLGHNYDFAETVAPTCTEEGYDLHICLRDPAHRYEDNFVPALGHDWGAWTENGDGHIRICQRDDAHTEAKAHNWSAWTDNGEGKHVRTCSVCGAEETSVHVWDDGVVTKAATCREEGAKLFTCTVCGATKMEAVSVDPDNHADYGTKVLNAAEATCTKDGYTGDTVCNGCGAVLEAGETIRALGHDWGDWADNGDGNHIRLCQRDASHTEIAVHVWNDGEVTKVATCKEQGAKLFTCTVCGATKTEAVSVDPDNHADYGTQVVNAVEPTCTEKGNIGDTVCSGCGAVLSEGVTIPAHGHEYHKIDEKSVVPDYGVEGYDYYECRYDADHNYKLILPALVRNVYKVTFIADGEVVAVVPYTEGDKFVDEPAIPEKDNCTAEWAEYSLNDADITVEAVYTPIDLNDISDMETEKTVDSFEKGVAAITLSASAATRAIRFTTSTKKPVDVIMVLDLSGSMDEKLGEGVATTKMEALKACAVSFIEKVNSAGSDNRIALVGFASGDQRYNTSKWENTGLIVTDTTGFVGYPNAAAYYGSALMSTGDITGVDGRIIDAINGLEANGATCTHIGLLMAKSILAQNGADGREKVVVLITDGNPTIGSTTKSEINQAAPIAVTYANDIKNMGVKLYTVGVDANANENAGFTTSPDGVSVSGNTTTFDFNRFLNIVSTNYPDARAMNNYGAKKNNGYHMGVKDTSKLDEIFSKIIYSSVDRPVAFTKCNLIDTLSSDFTLTLEQEYAFRDALAGDYNIPDANVSVTRNADGTTTIRVNGVPAVKTEVDGKTVYKASVSFEASLNQTEAGAYVTNTDDAYVEVGGEQLVGFDVPAAKTIPADRNIVVFTINGEVYRIEEHSLGDAVTAPATALADWAIPEGTVVEGNYAEFEATGISTDSYIVTWDIDGEKTTETYAYGSRLSVPAVADKEELVFVGFTPAVPHIMPARNMTFTAVFAPKHVHQFRQTGYYGTCAEGLTVVSRCSCGEMVEEKQEARAHRFAAVIGNCVSNTLTDTLVCSVCGASEQHTLTFKTTVTNNRGKTTVLDLTLEKSGTVVQPAAGSTVKIMIPWTNQGYSNTNVRVTRVNEQGVEKTYNVTIEDGYLVFFADHFSIYLVEELDGQGNALEPVSYQRALCELNGTHSYSAIVTPPTCTEDGYTMFSCPVCGDSYADAATDKTGHAWSGWELIKAPTCTEEGQELRVCSNDGSHRETRPVAKTAHADSDGDGLCDNCGAEVGEGGGANQSNCVCGKYHSGPFAGFIKFFHTVVYFFKNLFKKN